MTSEHRLQRQEQYGVVMPSEGSGGESNKAAQRRLQSWRARTATMPLTRSCAGAPMLATRRTRVRHKSWVHVCTSAVRAAASGTCFSLVGLKSVMQVTFRADRCASPMSDARYRAGRMTCYEQMYPANPCVMRIERTCRQCTCVHAQRCFSVLEHIHAQCTLSCSVALLDPTA